MLSRALSLATVTLLIGCFAAIPVRAENLEAGKSPSQIFAGTCNACHKGPRGLLKTVSPGSLPGFLRQHYTTSSEMAGLLASYLVSNGATDTGRYVGAQPKPAKDAKLDGKPSGPPEQLDRWGHRLRQPASPPQEAAKPESEPQQAAKPDGDVAPAEAGHPGRDAKHMAKPGETPDGAKPAADGQVPAQASIERGPDGRKLTTRQKLGSKGKPGSEEPPKTGAEKPDIAKGEPSMGEPAKDAEPKTETSKDGGSKPEKPSSEGKSETAKVDAPKETGGEAAAPALRPDPVPAVTPAPASAPPAPAASVAASSGPSETAAPPPSAPSAAPAASAVTALSAPPVAPAGPPVPPISQ